MNKRQAKQQAYEVAEAALYKAYHQHPDPKVCAALAELANEMKHRGAKYGDRDLRRVRQSVARKQLHHQTDLRRLKEWNEGVMIVAEA